jgi:hypothetical protein
MKINSIQYNIIANIYAFDLFQYEFELCDSDNINWKYCVNNATFSHREACEFILYLYPGSVSDFETFTKELKEFGCTSDFIEAVIEARGAGAVYALFYV